MPFAGRTGSVERRRTGFLIYALFFDECSERELEEMMGIHRMTIHNRKIRILQKMKKMLR